ncbi:MAG TPA: hypothetical protein VGJ53_06770, partial [Micromonosporaceae bacterium]
DRDQQRHIQPAHDRLPSTVWRLAAPPCGCGDARPRRLAGGYGAPAPSVATTLATDLYDEPSARPRRRLMYLGGLRVPKTDAVLLRDLCCAICLLWSDVLV